MRSKSGYQIGRRVERQPFTAAGKELVNATLDQVSDALQAIIPDNQRKGLPVSASAAAREPVLQRLRDRCLKLGAELPWEQRGAILTLLGSAERAFNLIERIDEERRSVTRPVIAATAQTRESDVPGSTVPVPA
jgi:phosphate:Na+ symporter